MELIKTAIKVGNSAGVILPKKYLNSQVKIVLEPLNIKKDVLEIILKEDILKEVEGIYLTGSYARGEETIESDIDILIITNNLNKKIVKENYEIVCISRKEIERQIKENIFPILPMIKEAKVIMNKELIQNYVNEKLTKENLKWHLDTIKSAMKVVEKSIEVSKKLKINESDASAYSLILRLRTLYIIDCIRKNKLWNKKEFLNIIKKISGSLIAYEEYLRIKKGDKKLKNKLPIAEAENLMNYNNKKIKEIEKWLLQK